MISRHKISTVTNLLTTKRSKLKITSRGDFRLNLTSLKLNKFRKNENIVFNLCTTDVYIICFVWRPRRSVVWNNTLQHNALYILNYLNSSAVDTEIMWRSRRQRRVRPHRGTKPRPCSVGGCLYWSHFEQFRMWSWSSENLCFDIIHDFISNWMCGMSANLVQY